MRIRASLGALALTLSLSGCYTSDAPLLDAADTAHPLPIATKLVDLDADGLIFDDDGKMHETDLAWNGKGYADPAQADATTVTLYPLGGQADTFIVQQASPSSVLYVIATMSQDGSRATIRNVAAGSEAARAEKLQALGAVPQGFDEKDPAFKVTDRQQLLDAAAFEATLPGKDQFRYLVVRYIPIPPDPRGLPAAHNMADASGQSPVYWYAEGMAAEHGIAQKPIDLAKAATDYRKAAEGGIAGAMADLGRMLETGTGVTANAAEAVGWYEKGTQLGNTDAMLALARALLAGTGVTSDAGRAAYALHIAAASGNVDAMRLLAALLDKGDLIAPDRAERLFWLVKAAEAGDGDAGQQVADAIRSGDGTAPNPALAERFLAKLRQRNPGSSPLVDSAISGSDYRDFSADDRHYYMMGFLDMLWSIGDRLEAQGLSGDCAEGYAMDNVSNAGNGLTAELGDFARGHPGGNISEVAAGFVYAHCDTRRNLLLLDFYVLNFSGALALSDDAVHYFLQGAFSAAVEAHLAASRPKTAACIETIYDDDDAYGDLLDKMVGQDMDLVTNVMMQKLDVLCP
ncbi:MAG TPA: tetratricopeptide repeat protein [Devosiaceae bacterium]